MYGVAFSPNGKILATADLDGSAYLWSVADHSRISTLATPGSDNGVSSVAFSPNGKILATGDQNGNAYLWDVATGSRLATLPTPGPNSSVSSVAFSPSGKILATANQDGTTYLWSITTASHPDRQRPGHASRKPWDANPGQSAQRRVRHLRHDAVTQEVRGLVHDLGTRDRLRSHPALVRVPERPGPGRRRRRQRGQRAGALCSKRVAVLLS
jgi:WD40 repeat protein